MKKRGSLLLIVITLVFVLNNNLAIAEVPTYLNISPGNLTTPQLISNIPNQTISKNTNLTNSFDLDSYFYDLDSLTYNASSVENITISIDPITHSVSFYPDYNFEGTKTVTFNATNSFFTNSSNLVYLFVVNDTSPPTWSNPTKDKTTVFQNTIVKFYTDWTDTGGLSHYIFSINEGAGFTNYSNLSFSGNVNKSNYTLQISAAGGTVVYWKFYAYDVFGQMNVTDIQNFTVNATPTTPGTGTGTGTGSSDSSSDSSSSSDSIIGNILRRGVSESFNFTIDPAAGFNIDLTQGATGVVTIKVTNIGNVPLDFKIELSGLDEFKKTISDENFNLSGGDSKSVTIEISADKLTPPGIYYGTVKIITKAGVKEVPIVIILKALEAELTLNVDISKEYKSVKPGKIVKANITLENLKDLNENNLSFYYSVVDYYGNVINSKTEEFIFSERIKFLDKELEIPLGTKKGEYLFIARAVSGEKVALDSDSFKIGEGFNVASFIKANFLFMLIIFASIILALLMAKHHKNKERLRLLNLYMMITQLNKLIKEGKHDEAIDIYVRIKAIYGEPVSKTILENKTNLISEMKKLSETIDLKLLKKAEQIDIKQAENKESDKKEISQEIVKDSTSVEIKKPSEEVAPRPAPQNQVENKDVQQVNKTLQEAKIEIKSNDIPAIEIKKVENINEAKGELNKKMNSDKPKLNKVKTQLKQSKKIKTKKKK